MRPQPMALGYMRTDGGPNAVPLTKAQTHVRHAAIQLRADDESLTLKDTYVEVRPGIQRMFSQLLGAINFHLINGERLEVIIIFVTTDLGATTTAQAQARERIEDLGLRIEVIR